jgi:hypothetical protein
MAAATRSRGDLERLLEAHTAALGLGASAVKQRRGGLRRLLDWLETASGATWQARWQAVGAETAADWRVAAGATTPFQRASLLLAVEVLLCHRVLRPGYPWLVGQPFAVLSQELRTVTDRTDFDRLAGAAAAAGVQGRAVTTVVALLARVLVHTGKRLDQLVTSDLLDYAAACRPVSSQRAAGLHTAHLLLRTLGIVVDEPLTVGSRARLGRATVEELVDRHRIACRPVRDLLVRYLAERATALDYSSLRQVEIRLVGGFWADLERHHPGICSIRLPPEVALAWKQRARTLPDGRPRRDLHKLFMIVRGFYLDLAHWAAQDPDAWGAWVVPSPISAADMRQFHKDRHRQRARIHARIRALGPHLPAFVDAVHARLEHATQLLAAATSCPPGGTIVVDGRRYHRPPQPTRRDEMVGAGPLRLQALDEPGAPLRDCQLEEDSAFWTWAIVEVLRGSGIRLEELLELTHLSIRHYRMADGQLVVLLQIAPSKTDRERVLPVDPELAHALAMIVARARGDLGHIPLVARYDSLEHELGPPLPYLLQRRRGADRVLVTRQAARDLLQRAAVRADRRDADGALVRFAPHDFRRLFATEAVNAGLPIHVAAKLLGHLDLNTTQGYVAVYPEQVIRHTQAHLTRRRTLRPSEEYRQPTEQEWADFAQHFRRRKMALGDCYRPYGTDCPHEHACVRCPMLRMDPAQLPRLAQIQADTHRLLAEAREHGWDGEAAALETTLLHIADKQAQAQRIQATTGPPALGTQRPVVWLSLQPARRGTSRLAAT